VIKLTKWRRSAEGLVALHQAMRVRQLRLGNTRSSTGRSGVLDPLVEQRQHALGELAHQRYRAWSTRIPVAVE